MVWLLIKDNKIDNCIVYDPNSNWIPPNDTTLVEFDSNLPYDIGWLWNDGNPSNPIIPKTISQTTETVIANGPTVI